MATQESVTLFMLLLAAWQALLFRYTDHCEVCVGTAIANRNSVELEGLIGFFVNTLVLKAEVDGRQTFRELLEQVRKSHSERMRIRIYRSKNLWKRSPRPKQWSCTLISGDVRAAEHTAAGSVRTQIAVHADNDRQRKFDLSLFAREVGEGLNLVIEYKTDLFESAMIRQMFEHYRALLRGIINEPAGRISDSLYSMKLNSKRCLLTGTIQPENIRPVFACNMSLKHRLSARLMRWRLLLATHKSVIRS